MGTCMSRSKSSDNKTVDLNGQGQYRPTPQHAAGSNLVHNSTPPNEPPLRHASPPRPPLKIQPSAMGTVLNRPMEDVRAIYSMGRELGRGQFGVTHLCTNKITGELFACKSISKRKLANKDDVEDVRREVQIMHHLTGQPNIVELKG
eukprot:c22565_g1_i2 orf=1-438(-)